MTQITQAGIDQFIRSTTNASHAKLFQKNTSIAAPKLPAVLPVVLRMKPNNIEQLPNASSHKQQNEPGVAAAHVTSSLTKIERRDEK